MNRNTDSRSREESYAEKWEHTERVGNQEAPSPKGGKCDKKGKKAGLWTWELVSVGWSRAACN